MRKWIVCFITACSVAALLMLPSIASATTTTQSGSWTNGAGNLKISYTVALDWGVKKNVHGDFNAYKFGFITMKQTKVFGGSVHVVGYYAVHEGGHWYHQKTVNGALVWVWDTIPDEYATGWQQGAFSRSMTSGVTYQTNMLSPFSDWYLVDHCVSWEKGYVQYRLEVRADDGHLIHTILPPDITIY